MQVDKFFLSTLLSGYYLYRLAFFIAIQIGVIVQVRYTPLAQLLQSFIHLAPRLNKSLSNLAFGV